MNGLQLTTNPPLSLYVHVPWCVKKCPYCDFNSHENRQHMDESEYVDTLIQDIEEELPDIWGRPVTSIFIGGGTPSLFSAQAYERLLSALRARLAIRGTIEITLEANPGTADAGYFEGYAAAGINRLSLGVQSFNDHSLKALGRIHDGGQAFTAFELARAAGFDNINLDLMHGLPGQSLESAHADLNAAIDLSPEHISWYQLTLEPNTAFYHRPPNLPKEDTLVDIQAKGECLLQQGGYHQYEVSAYAQQGRQSAHNLNYWQFGDYIGIGAGAHSKITRVAEQQIIRKHKQRNPKSYMKSDTPFVAGQSTLPMSDLPLEFMMNALRLKSGVQKHLFFERTGLHLETIRPQLEKAKKLGLLTLDQSTLAPTEKGFNFLNELIELFFMDNLDNKMQTIIPVKS